RRCFRQGDDQRQSCRATQKCKPRAVLLHAPFGPVLGFFPRRRPPPPLQGMRPRVRFVSPTPPTPWRRPLMMHRTLLLVLLSSAAAPGFADDAPKPRKWLQAT